MATLSPVHIVLRPAPDMPTPGPKADPTLAQFMQSVQRWTREAEQAIRELETALNEARGKITV